MDEDLALLRLSRMRWNAPLSVAHANMLLDRLHFFSGMRLVDLGCGWGELLMCAHEQAGGAPASGHAAQTVRSIGVDIDSVALQRGRVLARQRGIGEGIEFVHADAATWSGSSERVLCVGSSHAFGSTQVALDALPALVLPGGRLLFGDCYWQTPPTPAAMDIFGDQIFTLAELVDGARAAGWRAIHMSTADQREWDEFESASRAGLQEWLLANNSDPRAEEVREWLDTRERRYLHDYRGILGFAYLVLAH